MTTVSDPDDVPAAKKSKLPLVLGIVLAILGGAGGFFGVTMGLLPFGGGAGTADDHGGAYGDEQSEEPVGDLPELAFVPLDPLLISIPSDSGRSFLRFAAQLEVRPQYAGEVEMLKPRIVDVLNGYLRSVDASELEDPSALITLRAQMLRRLQIVAGEGRIRDLLIMEFVFN